MTTIIDSGSRLGDLQRASVHDVAWHLRDREDLVVLRQGAGWLLSWGHEGAVQAGPGWVDRARSSLRPGGPGPFAGGLIGWVGYEAGRHVEQMPQGGSGPLPELGLRRYPGALTGRPGAWTLAGDAAWCAAAKAALRGVGPAPRWPAPAVSVREPDCENFTGGVSVALDAIARGDLYQVNLSRRLQVQGVDHPVQVFRRLPGAAQQALLLSPEGAVVSDSPELFLRVAGDRVLSIPIKGTRPLGQVQALLDDPKERAELTMIVDLVRNDLGRVCVPGSILAEPRTVEELPTLLHAVQPVHGRLRPGRDALDALAASFPPGSVTGAPKVQAMSLIHALEPVPRGVYTGAIGWFSDGGQAELSVAIRVAQIVGETAYLHVGGGIVADSQPRRELEETRLKAQSLLRALGGRSGPVREDAWDEASG